MVENQSFAALMTDLRLGEQAAAETVFSRYAQQLIALARTKLDQRLQQRVDPEDVIQSVYKSFFLRHR
jgi:RNA polymerase sigma-70 factor, ECF subfamily